MVLKRKDFLLIFASLVIFVLMLTIIFIVGMFMQYTDNRDNRLRTSSYILSEWISDSFKSSEYILNNVVNQIPLAEIKYPPDNIVPYLEYTSKLNEIRKTLPYAVFSGIIDSNGILSHSSSVDGFDYSNQGFYLKMKNHPETESVISNSFKSPEGYLYIAHGLNFEKQSDSFHAMAVIAIELGFFSAWIDKLEYEGSGTISIIDENGIVLARNNDDKTAIGKKFSSFSVDAELDPEISYQLLSIKSMQSGKKIYAVKQIINHPFYIIIEEENNQLRALLFPSILILFAFSIIITLASLTLNSLIVQNRINSELTKTLNELNIYFSNSLVGIVILNEDRIIQRVNQRLADILGNSSTEYFKGLSIEKFHISQESSKKFVKTYYPMLIRDEVFQVDYPFKRCDGSTIWLSVSGKANDQNEQSKNIVWIVEDITERRESTKKLLEMATKDPMTGLNNRRHFMEMGEREFALYNRHKRPVSILVIDIDKFKKINDTYGHNTGDKTIINFANICMQNLRSGDIAGRIGGEEFAVILPDTDLDLAHQVAERIRIRVQESSTSTSNNLPVITVSIGIAAVEYPALLERTLHNADTAMYEAKNNGRNKVVIYIADKNHE